MYNVKYKEVNHMNKLTKKQAELILHYTEYDDYKVTKIYENGFKATRTNEWIKSELYCNVFVDFADINVNHIYSQVTIVTMVLERYK